MKKLLLITAILLQFTNCKKKHEDLIYNGEVKGHSNICTGSTGFPVIIKVYNSSQYDSVGTLTLPNQFWIVDKKISFKMRPVQSGDEIYACLTFGYRPKQVIVWDVTSQ